MAVCGNCRAEGFRIRSRWVKGIQLPDECPQCKPDAFDGKITMPSDKKIWMGYEAHPNEYVKGEDGGFDRKPEYRAEQEAKLGLQSADDREAQEKAVKAKRASRRTLPMDAAEFSSALHKAAQIANWLEESARQGIDV